MAMWLIIRDENGTDVRLVYHNLIQDKRWDLGTMSAQWSDESVVEWIFENAQHLTPGDFIRMSNGTMLHWDGRAFEPERWQRMRSTRACA